VPPGEIPAALAALAAWQAQLAARLLAAPASPLVPQTAAGSDDELLTLPEAAKFLRCSTKTLYRRAKHMSCCRRNGRAPLFSKTGLQKWLTRQKA
jgi:hypothetical protein